MIALCKQLSYQMSDSIYCSFYFYLNFEFVNGAVRDISTHFVRSLHIR